jgi:hypothetical protein
VLAYANKKSDINVVDLGKYDGAKSRAVEVGALAVLLYHYAIMLSDPEGRGVPEAELSTAKMMAALNKIKVNVAQEHVERLLWATSIAHEEGLYWHPSNQPPEKFISSLLKENELFDRLLCIIIDKPKTRRITTRTLDGGNSK